MKRVSIVLLSLFLLGVLGIIASFYLTNSASLKKEKRSYYPTLTTRPTSFPSVTPSVSPTTTYCHASDLQALLVLSPGAGNVYGTFSLKNVSAHSCTIAGGGYITPHFRPSSVTNVTITHEGKSQNQPFILAPQTVIYSQLHYPNGPQCQSVGLNTVYVTYTYNISPTEEVTYKTQDGKSEHQLYTCKKATDLTDITIWRMSTKPITP